MDDSDAREYGVWWINDYSEARAAGLNLNDLQYTDEDALGFYNVLLNQTFHDLHGITGFNTTIPDEPAKDLGRIFAEYLTGLRDGSPKTIIDAWRYATRYIFDDVIAAIYRVVIYDSYTGLKVADYGNEQLPGYGHGMYKDPSESESEQPTYKALLQYDSWSC